ncbi:MAG: glycosyltransferase family 2 protein [Acidobacteriales bacterium]|nr:glycosyltransferase family 2 protein [Terriglobales bacterium]
MTIGLPVYNNADWLRAAVSSVLAQTFSDWELILCDDGSTDGSALIANTFDDPRVHVLTGPHLGLSAQLNRIANLARGRYLARMDADDVLHPERIERQISFLAKHADVDLVGCSLVVIRGWDPVGIRTFPTEHEAIVRNPLSGVRLAHATALARVEWFLAHPYNESNNGAEDWELWFSALQDSRFANIADPLYFYREYDSFSLRKYVRVKRHTARLICREGPAMTNLLRTGACAFRQYFNIAAYVAAGVSGLTQWLIASRSRTLDESERSFFAGVLGSVPAALPRQSRLPAFASCGD